MILLLNRSVTFLCVMHYSALELSLTTYKPTNAFHAVVKSALMLYHEPQRAGQPQIYLRLEDYI